MIYIKQNQTNNFILRLNDMRTLDEPYYLFKFNNVFTKSEISYLTEDNSDYVCAYNLFTIVHSSTGSSTQSFDGPLNMTSGQWDYNVWESATASFNISDTTGKILDTGILVVEMNRDVNNTIKNVYR
jgi:hypothetical protein